MRLRRAGSATAKPRKQPTNLSIDAELLGLAKEAGLNLSAELEHRLRAVLRQRARDQWQEENREAIDSYNAGIEKRGVFSTGLRRF